VSDESPKPDVISAVGTLSQGEKNKLEMVRASLMLQTQFSGPLPPPELLDQYNKILPGAAERIISMAEKQGESRRHLETVVIEANAFSEKLGPILGFIIAMTAIIGGIWLISKGLKTEGLVAVLTAIAAPVGVFVFGKYQQQKELEAKRDDPPPKKPSRKRRR
jgi:uncharacterized membrane protein